MKRKQSLHGKKEFFHKNLSIMVKDNG